MHSVASKLTEALNAAIEVESEINYVIGLIANATDSSLSAMQVSLRSADVAPMLDTTVPKSESPAAFNCQGCKADFESELSSLLQTGVEHHVQCEADSCSQGDDQSSLLQGRVQMKLAQANAQQRIEEARGQLATSKKREIPGSDKAVMETRRRLHKEVDRLVIRLKGGVRKLLELLKPALLQIGKWLNSMGDKMQGYIEEFSIVLDRVQKIFDEVMEKIAGQEGFSETLMGSLFAIFDTDETGYVSLKNFRHMADLYGITEFMGTKGQSLMTKYDADKDGKLSEQEFALMIKDDTIPKVTSMVLRRFSKRLSQISGQVGDAKKRDEVAHTVVEYLTLVCSKNMTKMQWASQALGNGSLSVDFVADVLKQFAENAQDPSIISVVDVGGLSIREIAKSNKAVLDEAVKRLSSPRWWKESGFDPADQADIVKRVTKWVHEVIGDTPELLAVVDVGSHDLSTDELADAVHSAISKRSRQYAAHQRAVKASEFENLFSSDISLDFFRGLTGRSVLVGSGLGDDVDASRVVNSGADARSETLDFASELAANASSIAGLLQNMSFDHAHTSSSALESFAMQIQSVLKKTSTFLNLMKRYSTPSGIRELEAKLEKFIDHALDDVMHVVDQQINKTLTAVGKKLDDISLLEEQPTTLTGIWREIVVFTSEVKSVLPSAIDNVKLARREVSAVAAAMDSIFSVFKIKGWPIFQKVMALWGRLWVVYYITFAIICSSLLFYAFWSVGYFGGPEVYEDDDAVSPTSIQARCSNCCRAFASCLDSYTDSNLCWWSALLFANFIVLLMFIASCILVLLAGVKTFIGNGCAEIYLLNDNIICQELMKGIQHWLNTFLLQDPVDISEVCVSKTLMTCGVISEQMHNSTVFTTLGSLLASLFTWQMILESARLHESARWRRMKEENTLPIIKQD